MEEHNGQYTAKAAYPYTTFDGRKEYGCLQCINLWFQQPEDVLDVLKKAGVEHWVVCKDDIWDRNVILKSNSIAEAEYKEKKRIQDRDDDARALVEKINSQPEAVGIGIPGIGKDGGFRFEVRRTKPAEYDPKVSHNVRRYVRLYVVKGDQEHNILDISEYFTGGMTKNFLRKKLIRDLYYLDVEDRKHLTRELIERVQRIERAVFSGTYKRGMK